MENLVDALNTFRGKRVLITGDTGFKGSWLSLWLHQHGAQVFGFALPPESNSHFTALNLSNLIQHENGDVRDFRHLSTFIRDIQPEIIFHLAAQALVITSYADPKETFDTNVGGGINLLETVRQTPGIRALVFITSDKCYQNKEVARGYVESDELGGRDPYSASKAAAELVFASYAQSFFAQRPSFGAASARAGNVIGGGDYAENRIIPDLIRGVLYGKATNIRNPRSTRPWQHVLDPLWGYLLTLSALIEGRQIKSINFAPREVSKSVLEVTQIAKSVWNEIQIEEINIDERSAQNQALESIELHLNSKLAEELLGWKPEFSQEEAVKSSINWWKSLQTSKIPASELISADVKAFLQRKAL